MNRTEIMRARLIDDLPEPEGVPSIEYAISELGETHDAVLRQERTDDKRNNERAHDPRHELGQAIVMFRTAERQFKAGNGGAIDRQYCANMRNIYEGIADIWAELAEGKYPDPRQWDFLYADLNEYAIHLGTTFAQAEEMACQAFEAKHGKVKA